MRLFVTTALVALFLTPAVGCAAKPILNLHDVAIPAKVDGSSHTVEAVQAAIIRGCTERTWVPVVEGEGTIHASIAVRGKHFAEIDIPFSASSYSIIYVSSENLDYNAERQRIHRNYNNWIVKLSASINRAIQESSD